MLFGNIYYPIIFFFFNDLRLTRQSFGWIMMVWGGKKRGKNVIW